MEIKDQWLNMTKLSHHLGVSVSTICSWERQGLIHACGEGRGRLFRLAEAVAAKAPIGYQPVAEASRRSGVPYSTLYAWERARFIPPFLRVSERKAYMKETDISRVRAWLQWRTDPRFFTEYRGNFSVNTCAGDLDAFEAAVARGDIPDRYNAAHFSPKGALYDHET